MGEIMHMTTGKPLTTPLESIIDDPEFILNAPVGAPIFSPDGTKVVMYLIGENVVMYLIGENVQI